MMRPLLLLLGLLFALFLPARAGHAPPKVLMRVFLQTNEGMPETEARPVQIPPDNEVIQVRVLPEVTEQELTSVLTDPSGVVHLYFDHIGQVDLDAATAQNQGRIMVVMVDGIIVYAPVIDTQITNGELILPHPLSPDIIQQLQERARLNNAQAKRT